MSLRRAGSEEEVAASVGEVPWPALVALAAIRNVSLYRSLAAIPTSPGMLIVGFPDGTLQKIFFEELLPPGFADFIPGEDNGDRYGQEGEDVAWAIYDEALKRAVDIRREVPKPN